MTAVFYRRLAPFREMLACSVDASSLGAFRFLFGSLMVWEVIRYFQYDFIGRYYIEPTFYFTYELFPFVAPLPGNWMYALFVAMGFLALGIALGFYYRLSALLFFLSYTYVFLLDKAPYNNHYYLISLISFLLIFANAHHWASLDKIRKPKPDTVPFWALFLLRAQIFIVYFYGGLAKLNGDWLVGEPMRIWLAERADYPLLGPFFTTEWAVYFFSYGGLLFDLFIGFLLLWPPTRFLAFIVVLFFHLTNNWLFSIGIFPFLGIAATILFVEPGWPRRILRCFARLLPGFQFQLMPGPARPTFLSIWTFGFVVIYLALQLLIPLRHWLYPGNVSWTEEGHRFAWHMKLRDKVGRLAIEVADPKTGQTWPVALSEDLTPRQIREMSTRPDMILQYAHYLREKFQHRGIENPLIKANVWVSLNGRPFQLHIDPNTNLAEINADPFTPADWIIPLEESLLYDSIPALYLLTIMTMILTNTGLVLSGYFFFAHCRALKSVFPGSINSDTYRGGATDQTWLMSQAQVAVLIKVSSNILPYLLILLSLAVWTVTGELAWLNTALVTTILGAAWAYNLAPTLASRPDHSFPFRLTPFLINLLIGLFLLMITIVAVQN
jgi:hypothetical protein